MIKLVSLNIERSRHVDLILPFLARVKPGVVCLMELMEHDIPAIAAVVGEHHVFEPMCYMEHKGEKPGLQGVAIFSRFPLKNIETHYYHGEKGVLHTFDGDNIAATNNHMLLIAEVDTGDAVYKFATTHFPVTPKGLPDDVQRKSVKSLLKILKSQGEIVFCGDFNAARGGEIAAELIAEYKDNVPPSYTMSLDVSFHRASAETLAANARAMGVPGQMVDYIFSTPGYSVTNLTMESGLSDHQALIATVSKS
ncbi:MAG: endonuclease/exonuclease/phosphatase [Parcubacteria group bacterium Gr01-1014_56]|nr:MAG: endonuclease/exonuclease/phosphatase [Parcubacteria group bacterium Gr01-1014_56]